MDSPGRPPRGSLRTRSPPASGHPVQLSGWRSLVDEHFHFFRTRDFLPLRTRVRFLAISAMAPGEFIAKWRVSELKESSAAQEHFIDLCHLLGEGRPVSRF